MSGVGSGGFEDKDCECEDDMYITFPTNKKANRDLEQHLRNTDNLISGRVDHEGDSVFNVLVIIAFAIFLYKTIEWIVT